MFILTQDKKKIIGVDNGILQISGGYVTYQSEVGERSILLGKYESEEEAQKILQQIFEAVANGKVFEMPDVIKTSEEPFVINVIVSE